MIPFLLQRAGLGRGQASASTPVDPSLVSLLLHFDGEDASTTIVDASSYGASPVVAGNAQLSATQKRFGETSLLLDGSGDWIQVSSSAGPVPEHLRISSDVFTLEAWVYRTSSVAGVIFSSRNDGTGTAGLNFQIQADGNLRCWVGSTANNGSGATVPLNTWTHVACARSDGSLRMYVAGTQVFSGGSSVGESTTNGVRVGASNDGGGSFVGFIDELRVLKGFAAYTGAFTPPASAYA